MAGVGTVSGSADPDISGADWMDEVQNEVVELWGRAPRLLQSVAGTNAITATCVGITPTAYFNGMIFLGELVNAPTGAATMNINSMGAKALVDDAGNALTSGILSANTLYAFQYLSGDNHIRALSTSQLNKVLDWQTFTGNGTWTKPSNATGDEVVHVLLWGGGGGGSTGGNGGGGGGGGFHEYKFRASDLGGTETVTIGAGGAAGATGSVGGNSTFGAKLTAYGGGGGGSGGGGGGGGMTGAGSSGGTNDGGAGGGIAAGAAGINATSPPGDGSAGGGGGGANSSPEHDGGDSFYGGGGGGGGLVHGDGGSSIHGGGGGGGASTGVGGTSVHGGNGGANGVAGTQPAGGGGRNAAGAAGKCIVITIG